LSMWVWLEMLNIRWTRGLVFWYWNQFSSIAHCKFLNKICLLILVYSNVHTSGSLWAATVVCKGSVHTLWTFTFSGGGCSVQCAQFSSKLGIPSL